MMKVNLNKLVNACWTSADIEMYFYKRTEEIIDEYDYSLLSKNEKEQCIRIPKIGLKEQEQCIKLYMEKLNKKELDSKLQKYIEILGKSIMSCFHIMAEDSGIWEDYLEYQDEYAKEFAKKICKEKNFEYYEKDEEMSSETFFKEYLNEDRVNYYDNKSKKNRKK